MSHSHTLIIGAGIVGVSAAYELARRGCRVTLVDKGDIGAGASFGNAGIIAVGHPPLPRPGLVWQTLKWMLDGGSPLYVPPRLDPALAAWMWQFARACNPHHFARSMEWLTILGIESKKCFDRIIDDEKLDCEYQNTGWIEVFLTQKAMAHGLSDAALLEQYGLTARRLTGDEVRREQPAFLESIIGGVHYTDSAFANPLKFLTELADRAARHGAELRTNAEVRRIDIDADRFVGVELASGERIEADSLVLAAGSWTTPLARSIGVNIPMQPGKGYHLNITAPDPCPTIACVAADRHLAITPMAGGLRLAGTVELSGLNERLVQRRLDMLIEGARVFLRGIDETQIISSWCGLRPCTADGLPVIGWAPGLSNVFIATGHAKMGFALGPITGQLITQCIVGDAPAVDLTPYRVDRFRQRRGRRRSQHRMDAALQPAHAETSRS